MDTNHYMDFFTTAANNFKYSFQEQLLFFAQKPDATACAEVSWWNKHGRWVNRNTKGIALLVGLGSMFGAILEVSGGAQTLAVTMVRKFGDEKAAWALGITGLVIAMPVFFDAGLIILIPLAFSLAKRTKRWCPPA